MLVSVRIQTNVFLLKPETLNLRSWKVADETIRGLNIDSGTKPHNNASIGCGRKIEREKSRIPKRECRWISITMWRSTSRLLIDLKWNFSLPLYQRLLSIEFKVKANDFSEKFRINLSQNLNGGSKWEESVDHWCWRLTREVNINPIIEWQQ